MSTEIKDTKIFQPHRPYPDATSLLSIFPEEVWSTILQNVVDPVHFHTLSNSSLYFHKLLKPEITSSLFPLVAKVVFNLDKREGYFYSNWNPNLLFNLRLVCRSWKLGVDQVLSNPDYHYLFAEEKAEKARRGRIDIENKFLFFYHRSDFVAFQNHFDETHLAGGANPIPNRGINVQIPDEDDRITQFYSAFTDFLQKYGARIWYCILQCYHSKAMGQLQFFLRLPRFLEQLPNIKVFMCFNSDHEYADNFHLMDSLQSFPTLKSLVCVRFCSMPMPIRIIRLLIQSNSQVQIVDASEHQTPQHLQFYLQEMPNLTKLAIRIRNYAEFQSIRGFTVACKLNKLRFDVSALNVSWEDVFHILQKHFRQSLQELWISLPKRLDLSVPEDVHLEKLESLAVRMQNNVPLDFLLPSVSNLQTLCVDVVYYEGDAYDPFRLPGILKDAKLKISHSVKEIWLLFPKLSKCRIRKSKKQPRMTHFITWNSISNYDRR